MLNTKKWVQITFTHQDGKKKITRPGKVLPWTKVYNRFDAWADIKTQDNS